MISNEKLREKIIDEAIHGNLIKNDVSLSPVNVFEVIDDIPYPIPSNWKWTTLDCVLNINTGLSFKKDEQSQEPDGCVRVLRGGNINNDYTYSLKFDDIYVKKESYQELKCGDIITPSVTSMEQMGKIAYIDKDIDKVTAGGFVYIINSKDISILNPKYAMYYLGSKVHKKLSIPNINKSGQAFYNLKKSGLIQQLIPIPPLEEQKRIVEKIDEAFNLIGKKEKNDNEKNKFKETLKNKILESAFNGILVENDSSLKPIECEKFAGDVLFDIPSNWKWCEYKSIGTSGIGLTYRPEDIFDKGMIVLRSSNIQCGKLDLRDIVRVSCKVNDNIIVRDNDILICARNGSKRLVGKSCLLNNMDEQMTYGAFMTIFRTKYYRFVYWFMQSKYYYNQLYDNTNTMTINQVTQKKLNSLIIPLPPIEEQKRIVEKIEDLFELIEQL